MTEDGCEERSNSAVMTAPFPLDREMYSKWQLVRVADERESERERREDEIEVGYIQLCGSTVTLVRMSVPAVALRRGDADDSSLKVMKERVNEDSSFE